MPKWNVFTVREVLVGGLKREPLKCKFAQRPSMLTLSLICIGDHIIFCTRSSHMTWIILLKFPLFKAAAHTLSLLYVCSLLGTWQQWQFIAPFIKWFMPLGWGGTPNVLWLRQLSPGPLNYFDKSWLVKLEPTCGCWDFLKGHCKNTLQSVGQLGCFLSFWAQKSGTYSEFREVTQKKCR